MKRLGNNSRLLASKSRNAVLMWAITIGVWLLAPFLSWSSQADSFTKSVNDSAYFFRLTAKYLHGKEPVDFDIVVGCGVRITVYGDESSSYDALFDPRFFVKATRDGGAVLLDTPNACNGETTENGDVPADFLPTTVWFEKAGDFTLGTAYLSEDAYENPSAKLRFLGASIHKATRADWYAFRPTFAKNLLSTKPFMFGTPAPSDAEITTNLWNKSKLAQWLPVFRCYGVRRFHLSDPAARELLHKYWPADKPRFWMPADPAAKELKHKLYGLNGGKGPLINGIPYREYIPRYPARGWPTRAKGGTFYQGTLATEIYPFRADDGLPWLMPSLATAAVIYRDIDMKQGTTKGFAYCYAWLRYEAGTSLFDRHFPNYFKRKFETRVDNVSIRIEGISEVTPPDIPYIFLENDEYFYEEVNVDF
jgi:hypothetical protein